MTLRRPSRYGPYFAGLELSGRRVLVVGGSHSALRWLPLLLEAGADVVMVAPRLSPAFRPLVARGQITWRSCVYHPDDLDGVWLVLLCIGQSVLESEIAAEAERRKIFCVGRRESPRTTAYIPTSTVLRDLTVAAQRGGGDEQTDLLFEIADALEAGSVPGAGPEPPPPGVTFVGVGPGDGEMTLRARHLIAGGDLVVIDDPRARELLRTTLSREAELVDLAATRTTSPGQRSEDLRALLVARAGDGHSIIRVVFGDPLLDADIRDEAEFCRRSNIPVSIVPSVVFTIAAASQAGVALGSREGPQDIAIVRPKDILDGLVDWTAYATPHTTLVVHTNVSAIEEIARALVEGGRAPETATILITNPATESTSVLHTTLVDIAGAAGSRVGETETVMVIGAPQSVTRDVYGRPTEMASAYARGGRPRSDCS